MYIDNHETSFPFAGYLRIALLLRQGGGGGIQLTSSWAVGEKVRVYKGDVAMGELQAQTAGVLDIESGTTVNLTDVIVSGYTAATCPYCKHD